MLKIFQFFRRKYQPLEAMQIEISSKCNLKCSFCPTTQSSGIEDRLMSMETFSRLSPFFVMAKWVYLQGWGEPLLNKNIWKMVALAKEKGVKVGFTTNGTLMGKEEIQQLIKHKVDLVSISVAGADTNTHDRLRCESSFKEIITNIKNLVSLRSKYNLKLPRISLSYMLTRESINCLPDAIRIAATDIKADELFATNIDNVFNEQVNREKVFTWGENINLQYENIIAKAKVIAQAYNLPVRLYPLKLQEEEVVCELNPASFVFITSNGEVTPCVCLGRSCNKRIFKDTALEVPLKSFGNINEESFLAIWNKEKYLSFRNRFTDRLANYQEYLNAFIEPSLLKINMAQETYSKSLAELSLPEECKSCPKAYGV